MGSSSAPPEKAASCYRISAARICAVAFTAFVLTLAYRSYVDYCVIVPTYTAVAQIEVSHPLDPQSPDPIRGELEIISSPDVMSPIVTDLELDKIWAKRFRLPMDAMPMQDALRYLQQRSLRLEPAAGHPHHRHRGVQCNIIPKEAADLANAVANNRYLTMREVDAEVLFNQRARCHRGRNRAADEDRRAEIGRDGHHPLAIGKPQAPTSRPVQRD